MGFWDIVAKVVSTTLEAGGKMVEQQEKQKARLVKEAERKVSAKYQEGLKFEKEHPNMSTAQRKQFEEKMQKLENMEMQINSKAGNKSESARKRKTDDELYSDKTGTDKEPGSFQIEKNIPLEEARRIAKPETGVYILKLDGQVKKCGRAAYSQGVRWRLNQYYNLKYDSKAQKGDCWSINEENRDRVMVTWQCCPVSMCKELEYKLFKKYGKGEWGLRAPESCTTDEWELLI